MNNIQFSAEHNYRIVNLILAGLFLLIFSYSALFAPTGGNHPVPSFFTELTGENSPSTGLSRSFSAIIRGDIQLSKDFNSLGIPIFLFFFVQMLFRTLSLFIAKEKNVSIKLYIVIDIILSILSFYLVFKPLILFTFKLFRDTIVEYM